ncbi:MAG: GNAT family N-acetyltransferase [Gammaproteobacteria bacterium]|nr:MAG: GNAT family N-acetyltransferase [Gammaproteobacteria bacterium]
MNFRVMKQSDYDAIISLWQNAQGIKLRDADSREGIDKYLQRNPGLSFVAEFDGMVVGTIMAGHDGKRGYLQHLAVAVSHRKMGIATKLLTLCLSALKVEGIVKSHIHVLCENEAAKVYWKNRGWLKRDDIEAFSFINGGDENT